MVFERFPEIEEILFAMSEQPLGMGEEATVYRIHTNPKFTVRVSNRAPKLDQLGEQMAAVPFKRQPDIFDGRNYAQTVAYWGEDKLVPNTPLVTINLYSPGFSMEVHKPGRPKPNEEEALMRTIALSKAVLNMPDSAIDLLYDDLHFLSSREFSIDVGAAGLFQNTGNILYSGVDKKFSIIDLQPFIRQHVGIYEQHTKGFNVPLYLAKGLLPGAYCYRDQHSKYPALIDYRTEIVDKVIRGAKRNNWNDVGGYLGVDLAKIARFWDYQLKQLNVSDRHRESFVKEICAVNQQERYQIFRAPFELKRVAGRSMCS